MSEVELHDLTDWDNLYIKYIYNKILYIEKQGDYVLKLKGHDSWEFKQNIESEAIKLLLRVKFEINK